MNIEKELKKLEEEIAQCKSELSKAEGAIETLMKRLKEEEGIESLEEAEKVLKKLEAESSKLEDEIQSKLKELKEIYEW